MWIGDCRVWTEAAKGEERKFRNLSGVQYSFYYLIFLYLLQFLSELYRCHINNLVCFLHCVIVEKFYFEPPEPPPPPMHFTYCVF